MEDSAIVDLYWQRSEQAIAQSEIKYGGYCRTVAGNICRAHEDAEECVNDTWLSAWNQMPDKRPRKLGCFLGTICRNLAINRVRSQSRLKRGGGQTELALEELKDCIPAGESVEKQAELRELMHAVDSFAAALPRDERRIFIARYYFMASVEEIAEKQGFSASKVKTSLYRTRLKLRDRLKKEGLC